MLISSSHDHQLLLFVNLIALRQNQYVLMTLFALTSRCSHSTFGFVTIFHNRYTLYSSYFLLYLCCSSNHISFVTNMTRYVEPNSFAEIAYDPNWHQAMQLEIYALETNYLDSYSSSSCKGTHRLQMSLQYQISI